MKPGKLCIPKHIIVPGNVAHSPLWMDNFFLPPLLIMLALGNNTIIGLGPGCGITDKVVYLTVVLS